MPLPVYPMCTLFAHSIVRKTGSHLFMTTLAMLAPAIATAAVVRGSLIDPPVVLTTLTTSQIDSAGQHPNPVGQGQM